MIDQLQRGAAWMLLAGLVGTLWWWAFGEPLALRPGDGVLAAEPPRQLELPAAAAFEVPDFRLQPLASFAVQARVLSRLRYRSGVEAELSPLDFALGWGAMSDNRILDQLHFSHGGRFFNWSWDAAAPPLPAAQITLQATNVHLIPSSPVILHQLDRVRAGEVVQLRGLLVEAQRADGWRWRSSLRRDDSGAGACELLWVEEVVVVQR